MKEIKSIKHMTHFLRFLTSKKTRKACAIASTLWCFSIVTTSAQIVYTDIPDGVPTSIDFNSDGSPEFDIQQSGSYFIYFSYGSNNNIHALGNTTSGWDVPNCVPAGTTIGPNCNWIGSGDCDIDGWGQGNTSVTANTDEFLGVRFNFVGNTSVYYGWIRFTKSTAGAFTYKDYAYNSTPNASILTGQSSLTAIAPLAQSNLTLYPNPATDVLYVNSNSSNENYAIINQLGQVVLEGKVVNQTIEVASLEMGLYTIQVMDDRSGLRKTLKIMKQ
jgi:hypothetical protein